MVLNPSDRLTPPIFSPPAVCCVPPGITLGLSPDAAGTKLSYFVPGCRTLRSLDDVASDVVVGTCLVSSAMVCWCCGAELGEFYDRMRVGVFDVAIADCRH